MHGVHYSVIKKKDKYYPRVSLIIDNKEEDAFVLESDLVPFTFDEAYTKAKFYAETLALEMQTALGLRFSTEYEGEWEDFT